MRDRWVGWPQLRWMFTAFHLGHYIPLTWLTFGLDYVLWGMNLVGYHLTNLVLHMADTWSSARSRCGCWRPPCPAWEMGSGSSWAARRRPCSSPCIRCG